MPQLSFVIPGTPIPKGRPRFTRTGHCYTPAKTISYENQIHICFLKSVGTLFKPLECPIRLTMSAWFTAPKSRKKFFQKAKTTKPDLDNLIKTIDALNKIAWKDDSQIYSIIAQKFETDGPSAMIVTIEWD